MTLAILLIGLIVATCIIAYVADNIGKNMGKKRISLFGLRPRQTATLISMASSVAIMLLTVIILLLTSRSLSNALLRYDAEKKEANRQRRENQQLVSENQKLQSSFEEQSRRIKKQLAEIAQNRERAEQFSRQRRQAEAQLKSASTRLASARKGEASARARAQEAQKRLTSARRQFETFRAQLASAQRQVAAAKKGVAQAQAQAGTARAQLQNEQRQLTAARDQLRVAQQNLTSAHDELRIAEERQSAASTQLKQAQERLAVIERNFKGIQQKVRENLEELTEVQNRNAELQARSTQLQSDLERQRAGLEELTEIASDIATGNIAISRDELFAEITIPARISAGQAREALRDLLKKAQEHLSDPPRTLELSLPQVANNLSRDEFLDGFAAYLSTRGVPVSLRLLASRDHARGESKIYGRLLPIEVRTIFEKDEVLASITIAGDAGDARIFNQLLKLLNDTERRARERGVMPLLTPQNPLFYPTGTNERVFEALREIQSRKGAVLVRLIAAEEITSVDSPQVRFEVGDEETP